MLRLALLAPVVAFSVPGAVRRNGVGTARTRLSASTFRSTTPKTPPQPSSAESAASSDRASACADDQYRPHSTPQSEYLIGEEMVTNDAEATAYADRCCEEAYRLFDSQEGWQKEFEKEDIYVESKLVHGPYAKSEVRVVRGIGAIDASADDFYNFQVSREGFQSIDEYLVNHRNVQRYKWDSQPADKVAEEDYHLMMNRVEWRYPGKSREFVALDVVDKSRRLLISKSALHPARPGGSKYQDDVPLDEREYVRAVQYYAANVEPISDTRCMLTMVTWGEMCDSYSSFWVNQFNAHVFITPKFDRFRRAMSGEDVYQVANIVDNAWQLPQILRLLPDKGENAKSSDFVSKLKGFDAGTDRGEESDALDSL